MPGFGKQLVSEAVKVSYQLVDNDGKTYMTCDNLSQAKNHQKSLGEKLSKDINIKESRCI